MLTRVDARIEPGIVADEALALAKTAGWDWTPAHVARVVAMEPAGAWTARSPTGAALGIASCVVWEPIAWIGSMVVDERARGQGVGRALLRHSISFAQGRGARTIGLDATPLGRPLYASEGFEPALGESAIWTREGPPKPPALRSGEYAVYPVSPAEIMELHAYDRATYGANRARYLAALMADRPHQSFVAVHRKTGKFSGHAFASERGIGPLYADAPEAAAWLLAAIERAGAPARATVPAWNPTAERLFADAGYTKGRACVRMTRGEALPGRAGAVYSVGAWALG